MKFLTSHRSAQQRITAPSARAGLGLRGIRVELHVSGLGHALPGVHLLDAGSEVVPDLVEADLLQSVRVLTPVG